MDAFTNLVFRTHPNLEEPVQFNALREELKGLKPLGNLVQPELRRGSEATEVVVTVEEFSKLSPKIDNLQEEAVARSFRHYHWRRTRMHD